MKWIGVVSALTVLSGAVMFAGCNSAPAPTTGTTGEAKATEGAKLTGDIKIDGSSTVYKVTAAVAELFGEANSGVNVKVNISGTGGGFKKFAAGEIDIANASRPMKQEEIDLAKKNGIEFYEVPVAYDGLTVVVNEKNTWAKDLKVEELKKMFAPGSTITNWNQVRPEFPDKKITFYGAGRDSGTFDFFTKNIVGEEKAIRQDYQPSEDDNATVQGVAGDEGAIGYFGYAYYEENQDKLNAVAVNGIAPSAETVKNLTYQPLSRPEFIYVTTKAAERPEVQAFVKFYLSADGQGLVKRAGYVPFDPATYERIAKMWDAKKTGSIFVDAAGKPVEDVLTAAGF